MQIKQDWTILCIQTSCVASNYHEYARSQIFSLEKTVQYIRWLLEILTKMKNPDGFIYPRCGNDHRYEITNHHLYDCT
jgi:hypothetical protein